MRLKEFDIPLSQIERRIRAPYAWMRLVVMSAAMLGDALVVLSAGVWGAFLYGRINFGVWEAAEANIDFAILIAMIYVSLNVLKGRYQVSQYVGARVDAARTFALWLTAFVLLFAVSFATKTTDLYSRAVVAGVFVAGLPLVIVFRALVARLLTVGSKIGVIPARRVMLVGREADITAFARRYQPWNAGLEIVGTGILDPRGLDEPSERTLARIGAQAREMFLDDVMIIVPWSETESIDRVVDTFMRLPVALHLGPERVFERFGQLRIRHAGGIASLQLGRPPLSIGEVTAKRAMDVALAAVGLFALLPVFAVIAVLVKLDSPGPVFFRQHRLGFNQRAFRIWKFRTMTTAEDGAVIRQATQGDARITRVGRVLRKLSLDELPQLWNVLLGEMSLVGPRPHAIAHDREYDAKIALYARRHNVKPGITGWAQIHGLRGETDTDDKMRARVEHDLYYIDHWSVGLDLSILIRTVLSPRTFDNAR